MKLILLHDTVRKHITSSLVQSTELMRQRETASIHEKENSCQFLFAGIHSNFFMLIGLIITLPFTKFTVVQKFPKMHNSNSAY